MTQHGVKPRISEHHFPRGARCRVAFKYGTNVFSDFLQKHTQPSEGEKGKRRRGEKEKEKSLRRQASGYKDRSSFP
jgi:hypothetical protein